MMEKKIVEKVKDIVFIGETIEKNEVFLEIKMCMFDNKVNLNNVCYTKEFLQEIVDNQEKYICLPLVCDTWALLNCEKMTHMYDEYEGKFYTTQIGSFKKFELEYGEDDLVKLIGYARVPKRNEDICEALNFLHEHGELKFSYEIIAKTYNVVDNITIVDAAEENSLIGLAVVSNPAYPNAVSLLVAENQEKGGENMENQIETASDVLTTDVANAEETKVVKVIEEDDDEKECKEDTECGKCDPKPKKSCGESTAEELNAKIGELSDIITELRAEIESHKTEIAELTVYKEKFEAAEIQKAEEEKQVKIAELRAKAEKVLNETELAEVKEDIESLNEVAVMKKISDKYIAEYTAREQQIQLAEMSQANNAYRIVDGMNSGEKKYFTV